MGLCHSREIEESGNLLPKQFGSKRYYKNPLRSNGRKLANYLHDQSFKENLDHKSSENSKVYVSYFEKPNPLIIEIMGTPEPTMRSITITSKLVVPQSFAHKDSTYMMCCDTHVHL
ncbi:hypothetical protein Ahia01_000512000 [Argonauta hians]